MLLILLILGPLGPALPATAVDIPGHTIRYAVEGCGTLPATTGVIFEFCGVRFHASQAQGGSNLRTTVTLDFRFLFTERQLGIGFNNANLAMVVDAEKGDRMVVTLEVYNPSVCDATLLARLSPAAFGTYGNVTLYWWSVSQGETFSASDLTYVRGSLGTPADVDTARSFLVRLAWCPGESEIFESVGADWVDTLAASMHRNSWSFVWQDPPFTIRSASERPGQASVEHDGGTGSLELDLAGGVSVDFDQVPQEFDAETFSEDGRLFDLRFVNTFPGGALHASAAGSSISFDIQSYDHAWGRFLIADGAEQGLVVEGFAPEDEAAKYWNNGSLDIVHTQGNDRREEVHVRNATTVAFRIGQGHEYAFDEEVESDSMRVGASGGVDGQEVEFCWPSLGGCRKIHDSRGPRDQFVHWRHDGSMDVLFEPGEGNRLKVDQAPSDFDAQILSQGGPLTTNSPRGRITNFNLSYSDPSARSQVDWQIFNEHDEVQVALGNLSGFGVTLDGDGVWTNGISPNGTGSLSLSVLQLWRPPYTLWIGLEGTGVKGFEAAHSEIDQRHHLEVHAELVECCGFLDYSANPRAWEGNGVWQIEPVHAALRPIDSELALVEWTSDVEIMGIGKSFERVVRSGWCTSDATEDDSVLLCPTIV